MSRILQNKRLLFLSTILLLIILVSIAIYFIDTSRQTYTPRGYENVKKEILQLEKSEKISNNAAYRRVLRKLTEIENQELSKAEQAEQFRLLDSYLYQVYVETNDPEIYKFYQEFKQFAESNYGDLGLKINVQCQDPTCAEEPIPDEILAVINEIEASNIDENLKTETVLQLRNTSYLNEKDAEIKVVQFLGLADSIKSEKLFVDEGINQKLYDEIREFVQSKYPDLFNKYKDQVRSIPEEE